MRVAVIGGVVSTELLIAKLFQHGFKDVYVFGFSPDNPSLVSGWVDLGISAKKLGFRFSKFKRVDECKAEIECFKPDVLFAVGLSQIVPLSILSISKRANIGFHPTALPRGRGRAALAWLILEDENGAATFFEMGEEVDDGPIYVQEPFEIEPCDNALDVENKLLIAGAKALDRWLPCIKENNFKTFDQDYSLATWFGKRAPEDGFIDWSMRASDICRLVRAAAPPHPGAYSFASNNFIKILSAKPSSRPERGVIGRVLKVCDDGCFEVQSGTGLVLVDSWTGPDQWKPKVGALLGYYEQLEIYRLQGQIVEMSKKIEALERAIHGDLGRRA